MQSNKTLWRWRSFFFRSLSLHSLCRLFVVDVFVIVVVPFVSIFRVCSVVVCVLFLLFVVVSPSVVHLIHLDTSTTVCLLCADCEMVFANFIRIAIFTRDIILLHVQFHIEEMRFMKKSNMKHKNTTMRRCYSGFLLVVVVVVIFRLLLLLLLLFALNRWRYLLQLFAFMYAVCEAEITWSVFLLFFSSFALTHKNANE